MVIAVASEIVLNWLQLKCTLSELQIRYLNTKNPIVARASLNNYLSTTPH